MSRGTKFLGVSTSTADVRTLTLNRFEGAAGAELGALKPKVEDLKGGWKGGLPASAVGKGFGADAQSFSPRPQHTGAKAEPA